MDKNKQNNVKMSAKRRQLKSSAECYNVLSPFFELLSVIYRWIRNEMFYLLSSSDVAYLDYVDIYKAFNFAASPKIERYNVLSPF